MLLTTHYMEEAERLCDRVAIVDHGQLIALGTPQELIAKLRGAATSSSSRASRSSRRASFSDLDRMPRRHARAATRWQLRVDSLAERGAAAARHRRAAAARSSMTLSTHAATLEDLFVSLTGRELRDA